jgi:hypothetical protein
MQKIGVNTLDSYFEILTTVPSGQAELGKLLQELKLQPTFFASLPNSMNRRAPQNCRGQEENRVGARSDLECRVLHRRGRLLACHDSSARESSSLLNNCTFEVLGTDADEQTVNFAYRDVYDLQSARSVSPHFLSCRAVICFLANRSLCTAPVRISNFSVCGQIAFIKK